MLYRNDVRQASYFGQMLDRAQTYARQMGDRSTTDVRMSVDNDKKKVGKRFMKKDVLDTQTFLKTYSKNDCYLFNSIASSMQSRKEITEFYQKKGFQFQSIIHPDIDTNYTKIGSGVFLQENSIV